MAKKRKAPDPSPDKLIRDQPRHYHTADGRFEVQAESTGTWYLTDNEQTNDFGLPILLGPYATLDAVKEAIAEAREGKVAAPAKVDAPPAAGKGPKLRVVKPGEGADEPDEADEADEPDEKPTSRAKAQANRSKPEPKQAKREPAGKPPPKPSRPTWLDRLEAADQRRARNLIEALEAEGVDDPEAVARADLETKMPQVARTLLLDAVWRDAIEPWADPVWVEESSRKRSGRAIQREAAAALRRLAEAGAEPADLAAVARLVAERSAGRALELTTLEGATRRKDLPGWRLTEDARDDDRPDRPILLSEDDLLRAAPAPPDEA